MKMTITNADIISFQSHLLDMERSPATIQKYLRDVTAFALWLGDRPITKENTMAWKAKLVASNRAPVGINATLSALNSFLRYAGFDDCRVRFLKVQRRTYRDESRELTEKEYHRLIAAAERLGRDRLALVLQTVCSTGIRVGELKFITVEAIQRGEATISLKGKVRYIVLPKKLCRKLLQYCRQHKITTGEVFLTRGGRSMGRSQIWAEMKKLCAEARVAPSKVFPHNLRHVFAVSFYNRYHDVVRLADVLGHSSVNTTRIYLMTSGAEHRQQIDMLGLVA